MRAFTRFLADEGTPNVFDCVAELRYPRSSAPASSATPTKTRPPSRSGVAFFDGVGVRLPFRSENESTSQSREFNESVSSSGAIVNETAGIGVFHSHTHAQPPSPSHAALAGCLEFRSAEVPNSWVEVDAAQLLLNYEKLYWLLHTVLQQQMNSE